VLSKRIIPCLDVRDGKLTKGIKFKGNIDIGDPVEMAAFYYDEGADELVFYDITASYERRDIMIETVRKVAERIFIPFSVGGGIRTVEDMRLVLLAGAEKVSINSAAIRDPGLIAKGAAAFGSQAIVLGMDVKRIPPSQQIPSGYEMVIDGGRTFTGLDALAWTKEGERLGAGEICLNSIDADGTRKGYELRLTKLIATNVSIPVIASGGAGAMEHIHEVFAEGMADAALTASITHYGTHTIKQIKSYLHEKAIKVRMTW